MNHQNSIKYNINKIVNKNINKKMNKKSNNPTSTLYIAVILAIGLNSINFIPLLLNIIKNKYTNNIPYLTLGFSLTSSLILSYICISNKYYIQLFLIFINIVVVTLIIFLKIYYDKSYNNNKYKETNITYNDYNESYANYSPPNNKKYRKWYDKTMCRHSLSPLGQKIPWKNMIPTANNTCGIKSDPYKSTIKNLPNCK
jgi:hypothetical protein